MRAFGIAATLVAALGLVLLVVGGLVAIWSDQSLEAGEQIALSGLVALGVAGGITFGMVMWF